ncbi:MAG: carboxypeptidase regulatory-like domain-containing protein [Bryobacteraceae bacterium]|nr:carboxypeptidase regulatory-like domain-containing protein [Bryobacteraceae bacterium]
MLHRLAVSLLLCSAAASAQNVTASLTGLIKDGTGASIPSAKVRATNTGTQATFDAVVEADGSYVFRALPAGLYQVRFEASGFQAREVRDIRLQVNEAARLDVTLSVASTNESVTVSSAVVNVDTTSATLRTVVDQKRIEELPLNGRNATQLMRLVAGVVADPRADVTSGTTYPGTTPVSVNGGRANATNYVLDGAQNNDLYSNAPNPFPNPDALQEFSVQTNNFSAEFGRQSGGLVNAITKSGTNQWHGSAFEFVRNQALNATNFFGPVDPATGRRRQDGLKRNQFGGTLGGPLVIPKVYNGKDRTFFFFSYQGTLERRVPAEVLRIVPTTLQRRGDFSAQARALRDPTTNAPFPGNLIPASRVSPISRFILDNTIPDAGAAGRLSTIVPTPLNDQQILARGDHQLSSANRLSGRYYRSWADSPAFLNQRNLLEQTSGGKWFNESISITDTHTLSPRLLNQALFSFNRTNGYFTPPQPTRSLADLGIKYYNDPIIKWDVNIAGFFRINTGDTNGFPRRELQFVDTLRWTLGKHNLTFGGEYGRGRNDIVNNFRANGVWDFNGAAPFSGDSLGDFLLGKFNSLTQGIGEYKNTRFHRLGLFVQDSFKVHRRLTLDAGVRWEPFFPFTDELDRVAVWQPGNQSRRYPNAPKGIIYAGDPGVPKGTVPVAWGNLGPRLGFAWDVFGDGKTAVRGAYGIFFDSFNSIATNSQANQAPFGTVVTVFGNAANSFSDPWLGTTNPFPGQKSPPSNVIFPDFSTQFLNAADFRNPYIQSWNFTLERELPAGFITRLAYAASKGTRLMTLREINAAVYAVGATTGTTNQRRPLAPGLGNVTLVEPVGNSTYHALQFTVERRYRKGVTLLANYQFSKSIDDTSANKGTGQVRTNPNNQAFDKGLSDFNRAHVFTFSGLWDLPLKFRHRAAQTLIGGWSLNSIMNLYAGQPITIGSGVDNARTGTGGQRADLIGDARLSTDRARNDLITEWLRRAAFAPNALGTFGNHGRNVFNGPGIATVDLGMGKRFAINERIATTFRFEAFNAFNRVNLANPTTAQNNGNFLRITGAGEPRILQLALRLTF